MSESYQMCSKCIMDSNDDPKITFDEKGFVVIAVGTMNWLTSML